MAASSLSFNGIVSPNPRVAVRTDASGSNTVNAGLTGVVAIVGHGAGPKPGSASPTADELAVATSTGQLRTLVKSGDLLEAGLKLYESSTSEFLQGRPQRVVCVPSNVSTRASRVLSNTVGQSQTISTVLWGDIANQTSIWVRAGSTAGLRYTVVAQGTTYEADNLGLVESTNTGFETSVMSLLYTPGGWTSAQMVVTPSGLVRVGGIKLLATGGYVAGGVMTADAGMPDTLTVVSSDAGDTAQVVSVLALVGGVPTWLTATLAGVSPVAMVDSYGVTAVATLVYAIQMNAAAAGTVQVSTSGATAVCNLTPGLLSRGVETQTAMYVHNSPVMLNPSATALGPPGDPTNGQVVISGLSSQGVPQIERVALVSDVVNQTTLSWSRIDTIYTGHLTLTGGPDDLFFHALMTTTSAAHTTLQEVADHFNGFNTGSAGLTATVHSGRTRMSPSSFDATSGTILIHATAGQVTAVETAAREWANATGVITAERTPFTGAVVTFTITAGAVGTWSVALGSFADGYLLSGTFTGTATTEGTAAALAAAIPLLWPVMYRPLISVSVVGAVVTVTFSDHLLSATPSFSITPAAGGALSFATPTAQVGTDQPPAVMAAAEMLLGGSDGVTYDWAAALAALDAERPNTIVVLSGEPSVHALLRAHIHARKDTQLACDGVVGLSALDGSGNATGALPSRTSIKTQIRALNSPYIRAVAERYTWFDSDSVQTKFDTWISAAVVAGMQAAAPVNEPLTHKELNILAVERDVSWHPDTHRDEMLDAGLWFVESNGIGLWNTRNLTTWLGSTNDNLNEASMVRIGNTVVRDLYARLSPKIGRPLLPSLIVDVIAQTQAGLGVHLRNGLITSFTSIAVETGSGYVSLTFGIKGTRSTNFIPVTLNLL